MSLEQIANNAQTTLSAALDNTATTLTVTDAASFPVVPQFRIAIENELLLVTSISGATWTVARGIEGSTATSHASASSVTQILTANGLQQLIDDALGAFSPSFIPATAGSGYTPATGDVVTLDESDQKWYLLSSSHLNKQVAVVARTSPSFLVQRIGKVTCGSGWTAGKTVWFVDASTTQTPPALPTVDGTTLQIIVELGIAVSSTEIQLDIKPVITRMAGSLAVNATMTMMHPPDSMLSRRLRAMTIDYGIARWKFDEGSGTTAADSIGANTGTLTNSPTWSAGHVGPYCLTFNGSNTYVSAGTTQFTTGATTVAFWANYAGSGGMHLADLRVITTNGTVFYYGSNAGTNYIAIGRRGTTGITPTYSPASMLTGWHHVCWTYNGLGEETLANYKLYIDGVQETALTDIGFTGTGWTVNMIGGDTGATNFFNGSIDDMRIYNFTLSAAQVSEIATAPYPDIASVFPVLIGAPSVNSGSTITLNADYTQTTTTTITNKLGGTYSVLAEMKIQS